MLKSKISLNQQIYTSKHLNITLYLESKYDANE